MTEKRKAIEISGTDSSDPNNVSYLQKPTKIIKTTISSAPVRYNSKEENLPAIFSSLPKTNTIPLSNSIAERDSYQGPKGTSYQEALKTTDKNSQPQFVFPHAAPKVAQQSTVQAPKRHVRVAADEVWEDPTLLEWKEDDFRIFVGDIGYEVSDDTLIKAFCKYPSFLKAKVIRDKKSSKSKGYGFVSFGDPKDFMKALKEMNGQYIGNRPCKLRKSNWRKREASV